MRIGIFGGSFDPVHHGHLLLAQACYEQMRLDRVEFVPAARQPLKPSGAVASDEDRVNMLRLAIADRPEFGLSSLEIERGGVSYTAETLREYHARMPDAKLYFLMGADSLADFPAWREPEAICELATPLVVRRPGAPEPEFEPLAPLVSPERLREIAASGVEMPATPISSTKIRALVAAGDGWRDMVPENVAAYIEERGLYR